MKNKVQKKERSPFFSIGMLLLVLLALAGYGAFRLDRAVAQASEIYVQFVCRQISAEAINQTVKEILQEDPAFTQGIYKIQYDKEGRVAAISTDTYKLNRARDRLVERLSMLLSEEAAREHSVRFGALMGSYLFAFWDPRLEMNISPLIYTQASIDTSLCAAGINQTQFTVSVAFNIGMSTSIINYESRFDTNIRVPLVELVLMGDTPNYYSR